MTLRPPAPRQFFRQGSRRDHGSELHGPKRPHGRRVAGAASWFFGPPRANAAAGAIRLDRDQGTHSGEGSVPTDGPAQRHAGDLTPGSTCKGLNNQTWSSQVPTPRRSAPGPERFASLDPGCRLAHSCCLNRSWETTSPLGVSLELSAAPLSRWSDQPKALTAASRPAVYEIGNVCAPTFVTGRFEFNCVARGALVSAMVRRRAPPLGSKLGSKVPPDWSVDRLGAVSRATHGRVGSAPAG